MSTRNQRGELKSIWILSDGEPTVGMHNHSTALNLTVCGVSGSLRTAASWIRNFVRSHPAYKFDSVVSQEINYDLMVAVDEM